MKAYLFTTIVFTCNLLNAQTFQNSGNAQNTFSEMFPVSSPDGKKIAFLSNKDNPKRTLRLFTCNMDGSGLFLVMNDSNAIFRATWFPDGKRLMFTRQAGKYYQLATVSEDGSDLQVLTNNTTYTNNSAALSPDGKWVAYESNRDGNNEIYVMNLQTKTEKRLTTNDSTDQAPAWSPDGKRIVFHSKRNGNNEIYVMNADGSNIMQLTNNPAADTDPQWSRDGKHFSFASNRDGNNEVYIMNADGSNALNISNNSKLDYWGNWLPGNKRIVFHSSRNGPLRLFTAYVDGTDVKQVLQ